METSGAGVVVLVSVFDPLGSKHIPYMLSERIPRICENELNNGLSPYKLN